MNIRTGSNVPQVLNEGQSGFVQPAGRFVIQGWD